MSLGTDIDVSSETPKLFGSRRRRLFAGRRGVVASSVSIVLVVAAIALILYRAPGAVLFRSYFLNFHDMWISWVGNPSLGISAIRNSLFTNIWMFMIAEVLILIAGLGLAWIRFSQSPVLLPFRILATVFTDVMRGLPTILVITLVGFGLPALKLPFISKLPLAVYGVIALTLNYSAYVSEVLRAGIFSVPNGQLLAARSLGLTHRSMMRHVILPQAVRTVIPPLLNDFISLQKDTALVSTLGAIEIFQAAQISQGTLFNGGGMVVASIFFVVLTVPMTRFTDYLMARDRVRRLVTS
jgi:polar amino acid transport system permease protein